MTVSAQLASRLGALGNLPSPSAVAARLIEQAADPDIDLAGLAELVSRDPVLTARLFRTANSALYRRREPVTGLRQALVLLGTDAAVSLALSFTLVDQLRRLATDAFDYERFWRRAFLAATAARTLGEAAGQPRGESLFLVGLIQDIGMLALARSTPGFYGDLSSLADHDLVCVYELDDLGCDHAAVGAWLLGRWRMPGPWTQAVAHSHRVAVGRSDDPAAVFNRCVALSGGIADVWLGGMEAATLQQVIADCRQSLGLSLGAVAGVMQEVRAQMAEVASLYDAATLPPDQADALLARADMLLADRGDTGADEPISQAARG